LEGGRVKIKAVSTFYLYLLYLLDQDSPLIKEAEL
jgi:hypothetical protein